jgi:Zn-dependent peptidase ImmA (M78 family)
MEWQADQFAARLLMPKKLMREAFGALFPAGLALPTELVASDRQLERQDWMNRVALEMVRKGGFENCSREAMRLRLEALKLVDCSGMRPLL